MPRRLLFIAGQMESMVSSNPEGFAAWAAANMSQSVPSAMAGVAVAMFRPQLGMQTDGLSPMAQMFDDHYRGVSVQARSELHAAQTSTEIASAMSMLMTADGRRRAIQSIDADPGRTLGWESGSFAGAVTSNVYMTMDDLAVSWASSHYGITSHIV